MDAISAAPTAQMGRALVEFRALAVVPRVERLGTGDFRG
jgi:hypothetical protein